MMSMERTIKTCLTVVAAFRTVAKMLRVSVPLGYRRRQPPKRLKLDRFVGIIGRFLEDDKIRLAKQRHASKRIFVLGRQLGSRHLTP